MPEKAPGEPRIYARWRHELDACTWHDPPREIRPTEEFVGGVATRPNAGGGLDEESGVGNGPNPEGPLGPYRSSRAEAKSNRKAESRWAS